MAGIRLAQMSLCKLTDSRLYMSRFTHRMFLALRWAEDCIREDETKLEKYLEYMDYMDSAASPLDKILNSPSDQSHWSIR